MLPENVKKIPDFARFLIRKYVSVLHQGRTSFLDFWLGTALKRLRIGLLNRNFKDREIFQFLIQRAQKIGIRLTLDPSRALNRRLSYGKTWISWFLANKCNQNWSGDPQNVKIWWTFDLGPNDTKKLKIGWLCGCLEPKMGLFLRTF